MMHQCNWHRCCEFLNWAVFVSFYLREIQSNIRVYVSVQHLIDKLKVNLIYILFYIFPDAVLSAAFHLSHFYFFQEVKQAGAEAKTEL